MTQEEKAKAHDEALKVIKKCVPDENGFITIYPQEIFPELNEDEDDKIKQRIIKLIKISSEVGGFALHKWEADEMLAWLEKQGNTNETINRDEFAQGVLRGAAINLITWIDYNVAKGNMCLSNMECKDIEDALVSGDWDKIYAYMKKKLEKPGEQKPVLEMKTPEESLGIDSETYSKIVDECIYGDDKDADKAADLVWRIK